MASRWKRDSELLRHPREGALSTKDVALGHEPAIGKVENQEGASQSRFSPVGVAQREHCLTSVAYMDGSVSRATGGCQSVTVRLTQDSFCLTMSALWSRF